MKFRFAALAVTAFLALGFLANAAPAAKIDSKEAKVRKLMQLTGARELGDQTINQMMEQFKESKDLPPGFAEKFKELAQSDGLVERLVPIYKRNLEESDIDGAIAFYNSRAGQNFIRAQQSIVKESMEIGGEWGKELATRTMDALNKEATPRKQP